jgi:hypothetical protein
VSKKERKEVYIKIVRRGCLVPTFSLIQNNVVERERSLWLIRYEGEGGGGGCDHGRVRLWKMTHDKKI